MKQMRNTKLIDFTTKLNETKHIVNNQKILSRFFANKKIGSNNLTSLVAKLFIILLLVIITGVAGMQIYTIIYSHAFAPGIKIAGYTLTGKPYQEVKNTFVTTTDAFSHKGINIIYRSKKINVAATSIADSPDSAFDLFSFNDDNTLAKAFNIGKDKNILNNIKTQIYYLIMKPNIPLDYYLDETKMLQLLKDNFQEFENPAYNATLTINNQNELEIQPEVYGTKFDYPSIINQIKQHLAYLDDRDIYINLLTDYPQNYAKNMSPLLAQAQQILHYAPYELIIPNSSLINANKKFIINRNDLAKLLGAKINPDASGQPPFIAGLKNDETAKYLDDNLSALVNVEPIDAKFQINNSKVTEFVSSTNGQQLNTAQTMNLIEKSMRDAIANKATSSPIIAIAIDVLKSDLANEAANNFGIKELIGTGHSNFSGSPSNRRHNISVGAAAVNGTLIKPGEEFSLLKTLGKIDGSTGYLPELVIKGNETVPEYGGGLCQIGTTVFRGSIDSGLLVTERQNHSYRVSYYEPAGTDATIYDPAPDFKFINDTKHYILIQSRIENNDLYFDFWGTNDNRKVTITDPTIYNITSPPPTKLIETSTLKPGEKKCTERAHNGADAYFDYMVEYNNGDKNEVRFKSHYRPWQEVCLIGVDNLDNMASSTTNNITLQNQTPN